MISHILGLFGGLNKVCVHNSTVKSIGDRNRSGTSDGVTSYLLCDLEHLLRHFMPQFLHL